MNKFVKHPIYIRLGRLRGIFSNPPTHYEAFLPTRKFFSDTHSPRLFFRRALFQTFSQKLLCSPERAWWFGRFKKVERLGIVVGLFLRYFIQMRNDEY